MLRQKCKKIQSDNLWTILHLSVGEQITNQDIDKNKEIKALNNNIISHIRSETVESALGKNAHGLDIKCVKS